MQFSYSFNLHTHLFNLDLWVKGENLSGELGLTVKMAEEMHEDEDSEVKSFFEHVINRTEEILSQNSFASSEHRLSQVLTI